MKKYTMGVICGRFQPLHNGHCFIIQAAIEQCDRVAIFIGSAQEYNTRKNPFTYYQRKEFLKREFGNQIEVYPITDLTNGTEINGEWGRYFLKTVYNYTGKKPEAIFSGAESVRDNWFYDYDYPDNKDKDIAEREGDRYREYNSDTIFFQYKYSPRAKWKRQSRYKGRVILELANV